MPGRAGLVPDAQMIGQHGQLRRAALAEAGVHAAACGVDHDRAAAAPVIDDRQADRPVQRGHVVDAHRRAVRDHQRTAGVLVALAGGRLHQQVGAPEHPDELGRAARRR